MVKNIGSLDRILRFVFGAILIALPFVTKAAIFQSGGMTALSVIVGAVLIGTAFINFCPIYRVLGIRTCKSC